MKSCDQYREFILDHLYGLRDSSDAAELSKHLESCPSCKADLARAEKQKKLLGVAARTQVGGQFTRPVETREPVKIRSFSVVSRVSWAIAATVLLAVAGIGVPGAYYWHQQDRVARLESRLGEITQAAERTNKGYHDRVAQTVNEVQGIQKQLQDSL